MSTCRECQYTRARPVRASSSMSRPRARTSARSRRREGSRRARSSDTIAIPPDAATAMAQAVGVVQPQPSVHETARQRVPPCVLCRGSGVLVARNRLARSPCRGDVGTYAHAVDHTDAGSKRCAAAEDEHAVARAATDRVVRASDSLCGGEGGIGPLGGERRGVGEVQLQVAPAHVGEGPSERLEMFEHVGPSGVENVDLAAPRRVDHPYRRPARGSRDDPLRMLGGGPR